MIRFDTSSCVCVCDDDGNRKGHTHAFIYLRIRNIEQRQSSVTCDMIWLTSRAGRSAKQTVHVSLVCHRHRRRRGHKNP